MKKALIVLLILAVAGGLFAQTTLSFSANVQTGLAIGFDDRDGDAGKPKIDNIRNRGEHGMRADLVGNIRSDDDAPYGIWGGQVYLRVRQDNLLDKAAAGDATLGLQPKAVDAFMWWQPNSFLYFQVGTAGGNPYETMGGLNRGLNIFDAAGLKVRLTPIDGLVLAGQLFYGNSTSATFSRLLEKTNFGFVAQYTAPGLVKAIANIRFDTDKTEAEGNVRFGLGVNFLGLSGVGFSKIAADFGTFNFGGDDSFMGFGPSIEFKAMDNNLTIGAKGAAYLYTGKADYDALPFYIHGNVSYKVGVVTPGIEARYLSGNTPNFNYRDAGELGGVDNVAAFNAGTGGKKDSKSFGISPSITFSVGPTIVLGYNLQMDLTDGATGRTLQHLIYTGVNITF